MENQCLTAPWSRVVSPHPAALAALRRAGAGDAFLISAVRLAGAWLLSLWAACEVWHCVRRGDGGLLIPESDLLLSENAGRETSPISGVVTLERSGVWILLCFFVVSPLC